MKEPPRSPQDVAWDDLRLRSEGNWTLTGPDSHGGTTAYRYKGQLFIVGYGEESSLPGGEEQVIGVRADNTPGFPPAWDDGHTAGCHHIRDWEWDSWRDGGRFLRIVRGTVHLLDGETELWNCPVEEILHPESERRQDVLNRLGPAVLGEMLLCAERQRLARSAS